MGLLHAHNLAYRTPGAELVAVCDADPGLAQRAADATRAPRWTTDYRQVLDDPAVEAVAIVTSTNTHAQVIVDAAGAGKHCFCEKPIALTLEETDAALEAVARAGVRLQVGFQRRFDPGCVEARRRIVAGEIGEIELVKATSRDPEPANRAYVESSGGLFRDLTIHDFDLVRFLTGAEVLELQVMGACLVDPMYRELDDPDTAVINLRFSNGAVGNIDNSRRAVYGYDVRTEVFGSRGSLRIGYEQATPVVALSAGGVCHDHVFWFPERYEAAYAAEIRAFVDCLQRDLPPPVTGLDGRRALEIADAATRSYKERRAVALG